MTIYRDMLLQNGCIEDCLTRLVPATGPDTITHKMASVDIKQKGEMVTKIYDNGQKYVGEFKDDKKNGQGTYSWPDGKKYVGEYKDDKKNGQGTFSWPDGEKYVGEFKDDKMNGQGTMYKKDGSTEFKGQWLNDNPVRS